MTRKIIALVLSVSLLVGTNMPVLAHNTSLKTSSEQFQISRQQMEAAQANISFFHSAQFRDVLLGVGIFSTVTAAMITFEFPSRLILSHCIKKWNRFAVELSEIGVPLELDKYALDLRLPYRGVRILYHSAPYPGASMWEIKGEMVTHLKQGYFVGEQMVINKEIQALSDEEADGIVIDYVLNQKKLGKAVEDFERILEKFGVSDPYNPSMFQAAKNFDASTRDALKNLRKFKAQWPQLTYSTEVLDRYFVKDVIFERHPWVSSEIKMYLSYLFNPAKIGAAEREAVAARAAASRGFLTRATSWVGKLGRRGPTHAAGKSATKAGKVGVVALVAMIGVGVAQASELQQVDADIQQRMIDNPMLAVNLTNEDAQFIEQHADSLPKTIEAYSAIAQGLYEFSQLSTQEQQDIVALLTEDTQKASSTRHTVPSLPKTARAR